MSHPSPSIPEHDASPEQVRTYFVTVLATYHRLSTDEASAIASNWKLGRGSELKYYDLETFRGIFGIEAGTLSYSYARNRPSRSSPGPNNNHKIRERDIFNLPPGLSIIYGTLVLALFFGYRAFSEWHAEDEKGDRGEVMCIISFFFTALFLFSYVIYYFPLR